MSTHASLCGYPPNIAIAPGAATILRPIAERERAKYDAIWQIDAYRNDSPGAQMAEMFERIARPKAGASVLDVGAGAGAGSKELAARGYAVQAFDLVKAEWIADGVVCYYGALWHAIESGRVKYDYAYCTDVMEHVPTELVGLAIYRILEKVEKGAFFSISFQPDNFGVYIQEPLHLTVKDFKWWCELFRELSTLQDARDIIGQGMFYVER